jgi:hypothetical protein
MRCARSIGLSACTLLAPVFASAQDDLLSSPRCRAAVSALQAAEQPSAGLQALDAARLAVERECLRSGRDAAPAQRSASVPATAAAASAPSAAAAQRRPMPPIDVPRISALPSRPAPPIARTPPAVPQPLTTTGCDATGCWASDGSRLPRAAPGSNTLLGPRGLCTPHGATLVCSP